MSRIGVARTFSERTIGSRPLSVAKMTRGSLRMPRDILMMSLPKRRNIIQLINYFPYLIRFKSINDLIGTRSFFYDLGKKD